MHKWFKILYEIAVFFWLGSAGSDETDDEAFIDIRAI